METATLIAQTLVTVFLAGWMTSAVRDNIQHPSINRDLIVLVMQMDRMAEMYPDEFKQIAHRRVASPAVHHAVYRIIVFCELATTVLLWIGVAWLLFAAFGAAEAGTARTAALIGTLAFTSVWAGFLTVGNHFGYWYCHEWAQNTHFQLAIWGTAGTILLVVPA